MNLLHQLLELLVWGAHIAVFFYFFTIMCINIEQKNQEEAKKYMKFMLYFLAMCLYGFMIALVF